MSDHTGVEVSELHDAKIIKDLSLDWGDNYTGWCLWEKGEEQGLSVFVPDTYIFQDTKVTATEEHKFFNAIRFPVFQLKTTVLFDFKNTPILAWHKDLDLFSKDPDNFKDYISKNYPKYFKLLNKFSLGKMPIYDLKAKLGGIVSFLYWSDDHQYTHEEEMLNYLRGTKSDGEEKEADV